MNLDDQPEMMWNEPPRQAGPNVLGIVGFVFSILCVTSPLGLLLSLIALAKPPRGFAIAGTIIGLIGTAAIGIGSFALFAGGGAMIKGLQIAFRFEEVRQAAATYAASNNGQMPASLADLGLTGDRAKDPWGNEYRFERSEDGKTWTFTTAAFDGQFGTPDDGIFKSDMDQTAMQSAISRMMEAHFNPRSRSASPAPAKQPAEAQSEEKPAESPGDDAKEPQ